MVFNALSSLSSIVNSSWLSPVLHWLAYGLWELSWWQVLLYVLLTTHLTIVSVTIFSHRHQAHRALDLHPAIAHFFRFWLWLGTGQVTKEWTAVHRKHHAKCETEQDPHSPMTKGIKKVLWQGVELYRVEAKNPETLAKYGQGTPDDWIERHLYTPYNWQGVVLMLALDLLLFGALGLSVWAIQMVWIPFFAAGVVNGIGHYWGYRNFESPAPDTSTNIVPWGVLIGGEELHNNHHTYPTSARFSIKPYEFDVGWFYISILQSLGLAKARKTAPKLQTNALPVPANQHTLEAVVAYRYEIMARYATMLRSICKAELAAAVNKHPLKESTRYLQLAMRWVHRDTERVPEQARSQLALARADHPVIDTVLAMREELRQIWLSTSVSHEQLLANLQAWCRRAEDSGIAALQEFSLLLRTARV